MSEDAKSTNPEHTGITKPSSVDGAKYRKAEENNEFSIPNKRWFTLGEACDLKNITYKTAVNKTYLQPRNGKAESRIGGRKMWRHETIRDWLELSDEELKEG